MILSTQASTVPEEARPLRLFGSIRKAVFPVAGLGTRFLPATKAMPKEMLPVVDKPLIQYAVEEAIAAGITQLIFITGRHKRAIEDHFDRSPELEAALLARGELAQLRALQAIAPDHVSFIYIRQPEPLGLGHAVLCAEPVIGDEPFAVLLADDLIDADEPAIGQLIGRHARLPQGGCVLATQTVPPDQVSRYGIVGWNDNSAATTSGDLNGIAVIVEKPALAQAPSCCAVVGRYVLEPTIFKPLRSAYAALAPREPGGLPVTELQLTHALSSLISAGVHPVELQGVRFDCGDKQGFAAANAHYARKS